MSRTALIIGIDNYKTFPKLTSCVNDAYTMEKMLKRHANEDKNYDCVRVTSDDQEITTKVLRGMVKKTLSDARGSDVILYFSGHGAASETGGFLVSQHGEPDDLGFPMAELMRYANQSMASSVLLILDCCQSGELGNTDDSPYLNQVTLSEGVTILAASSPTQKAQPGMEHSLFTELVLSALEGGAADIRGMVSAASIYAYVEQNCTSWQQRPMYKSHAKQLNAIRKCEHSVEDSLLRELPTLFRKGPDEKFFMDPSYEETEKEVAVADHVAIFKKFKKLRNARMLTTQESKDLYYCALDSCWVQLTPVGQLYYKLAKKGQL
jgi:hypothetical protein